LVYEFKSGWIQGNKHWGRSLLGKDCADDVVVVSGK
jgi:hypothetical protein